MTARTQGPRAWRSRRFGAPRSRHALLVVAAIAAFLGLGATPPSADASERKIFDFTTDEVAGRARSIGKPRSIGQARNIGPTDVVSQAVAYARANPETETSVAARIAFQFGRSSLTDDAKRDLAFVAEKMLLSANDDVLFVIEGHTDTVGSDTYNRDLSIERAFSARAHLIALGVDGERLIAVGYGEGAPLANLNPRDGANRRVEFLVELP